MAIYGVADGLYALGQGFMSFGLGQSRVNGWLNQYGYIHI